MESKNETQNNISKYFDVPGVWALYGKDKDGYKCLNVGKCKAVGQEILNDVAILHLVKNCNGGDRDYIKKIAGLSTNQGLHKSFYIRIFGMRSMRKLYLFEF